MTEMNTTQLVSEGIKANSLRTARVDFRTDIRWTEFLSLHPDATIYHHPGYLSALESEYGRQCIALACEGPDGNFQAILPLLSTRGLPWRFSRHNVGARLSSLPRTPVAGPLASNGEALKAILEAAVDLVRTGHHGQLEIKTMIQDLDRLVPALRGTAWRDTYVRGLPDNSSLEAEHAEACAETVTRNGCCDTCPELSFGNSRNNHKIKWATKRAESLGVETRIADSETDLRKWYPLYLQVMRKSAVPPRPFRFFKKLKSELCSINGFTLCMAEMPAKDSNSLPPASQSAESGPGSSKTASRAVSGSILLQYGQKVFWAFTGSNERGLQSHANDLGLLRCLQLSCKQRYRSFDLGEVAESHPTLSQFKAKWGTVRMPMYRYYFPPPSLREGQGTEGDPALLDQIACSIWKRLPLPVIATLGDWLNSFL